MESGKKSKQPNELAEQLLNDPFTMRKETDPIPGINPEDDRKIFKPKELAAPYGIIIPVVGPDDPSWPPVSKEQVDSIRKVIDGHIKEKGYTVSHGEHIPYKDNPFSHITVEKLFWKELRIPDAVANDIMRSTGRMKIWNTYTPEVFEKVFVEMGLLPIGYYYNTFDVETNELVFLSQDDYVTKRITRIRWKINFWFIKRGW